MKKFLIYLGLTVTGLCLFAASGASKDIGASLYDEAGPSVVTILPPDLRKTGGTGFAIHAPSGKDYILTNGHVCAVAQEGKVAVMVEGSARPRILKILEVSENTDLCLIEGAPSVKGLSLAHSLAWLRHLTVLGHPRLEPLTVSQGYVVSREDIQIEDEADAEHCKGPTRRLETSIGMLGPVETCVRTIEGIKTSVVIYPGNSGSPVFNDSGEVVGVMFAGDRAMNHGVMIPLEQIADFLSIF